MSDTKKLANEIHDAITKTIEQAKLVDKGDGFNLKDIRAIITIADTVLTEVEKVSAGESLTGAEKKEVATDVLTRLLSFDIPWVPNFLEGKVKAYAISFLIDYSVEFLNKKLGKNWLN